jgi:hypothetical protein
MRTAYIIALATLLSPVPAYAQNMSVVVQSGLRNSQVTVQTDRSVARTTQIGNDNAAATIQTGRNQYSTIVQIGDGHEQVNVQTKDYSAFGSVQVDAAHAGWTGNASGGYTAGGGIQLHFGVK